MSLHVTCDNCRITEELPNLDDFAALRDALAGIRGGFILSLNDRPEVRALFEGFHLLPMRTLYTIQARINTQSTAELLIGNVPFGVAQDRPFKAVQDGPLAG